MTSQQPDNMEPVPPDHGLSGGEASSVSSAEDASQAVESSRKEPAYQDLPDTLPPTPERYAGGFAFKDPIELLYFVDDEISSGRTKLHPWQIQFMIDFADGRNVKDHPFIAEVCAANGSGKDKYILAACVVWLCVRYLKAYSVATNGSGQQLDAQTEFHIRSMCLKFNTKIGFAVWKCNYRKYLCRHTAIEENHSVIELFATDEPAKAEGYHPVEDGSKLAIFASEAKSIPDGIFSALARCTGVTHRVDVSSPGLPAGYFFNQWTMALDRNSLSDIKECPPTERVKWTITAMDCPHITAVQIELFAKEEAAHGGRNSPIFKSGVLAQFCTQGESTVISYTHIHRCKSRPPTWQQEVYSHAGLDLNSGGESESVLKVRNGNKIVGTDAFNFEDTEDQLDYCEELFYKYDLDNPESLIWGDCCGAGYPQLCSLKRRGWDNIRFFDSRAASRKPKAYKNIVTEMWFNASLLFQRAELILDGDMQTETQLCTRYYKTLPSLQRQLLSKLEQRNKGYPSPDRADALIYSLVNYKTPWKEKTPTDEHRPVKRQPVKKPQGIFTQQMLVNQKDKGTIKDRLGPRPEMHLLQIQIDELNRQNRHNITSKAERD